MNCLKRLAALAVLVLIAVACDIGVRGTTTITIEPPTTETASTATSEVQTTTTAQIFTPSTGRVIGTDSVGNRESLLQLFEAALDLSESLLDADGSTAPIPRINGADPVAALRELLMLDFWVYSNAPIDSWADVLAVNQSPDWELYLISFDPLLRVATFSESELTPYEILEAREATFEELNAFPESVRSDAGPGAVGVVYRSRLAPHVLRDPGEVDGGEPKEGWDNLEQVALVAPTELGWQFYWSAHR